MPVVMLHRACCCGAVCLAGVDLTLSGFTAGCCFNVPLSSTSEYYSLQSSIAGTYSLAFLNEQTLSGVEVCNYSSANIGTATRQNYSTINCGTPTGGLATSLVSAAVRTRKSDGKVIKVLVGPYQFARQAIVFSWSSCYDPTTGADLMGSYPIALGTSINNLYTCTRGPVSHKDGADCLLFAGGASNPPVGNGGVAVVTAP